MSVNCLLVKANADVSPHYNTNMRTNPMSS